MRIILLFVLFISFHVSAEHKLTGLWEGFNFEIKAYNSHILEINESGEGFYAFTLSGYLNKQNVFPINLNNLEFTDGFYKLVTQTREDMSVTVLIAEDMLKDLSVITIVRGPDKEVMFSFAWELVRIDGNLQNERLYKFGKELYNKKINKVT